MIYKVYLQNLNKQVRTPPVRPADGVVGCVFGFTKLTLGMVHWNFNGTAGEDIRQNRDKGAAFMAVQHRIDNMTAIGAQHTTVVTHR